VLTRQLNRRVRRLRRAGFLEGAYSIVSASPDYIAQSLPRNKDTGASTRKGLEGSLWEVLPEATTPAGCTPATLIQCVSA
jgi:hypothetical protein